jgi:hypothetical protein
LGGKKEKKKVEKETKWRKNGVKKEVKSAQLVTMFAPR